MYKEQNNKATENKAKGSKLSVIIDRDIYQRFKAKVALSGESITGTITKLIEEFLEKK